MTGSELAISSAEDLGKLRGCLIVDVAWVNGVLYLEVETGIETRWQVRLRPGLRAEITGLDIKAEAELAVSTRRLG